MITKTPDRLQSMNTVHDEAIDGKVIGITEHDLSPTERKALGRAPLVSMDISRPVTPEPDPLNSIESRYNGAIKTLIDSTPGLSAEDKIALTETSFRIADKTTGVPAPQRTSADTYSAPVSAVNQVSHPR